MGKARPRATSIPYYELRNAVEQGYGRRRMLYHSMMYGLVVGVPGGLWNYFSTPNPNLSVATGVAVVLTLAIPILMFLVQLVADTLSLSMKEEELVELCLERLAPWRNDPVTRAAICEMADRPSDGIQVRSPMGLIILTIVSSVAIAVQLPLLVGILIGELVLLAVISVAVVIGQGHADIVIRNSLIEFERRLAVGEAAVQQALVPETVSAPLPAPTPPVPAAPQPAPTAAPAIGSATTASD